MIWLFCPHCGVDRLSVRLHSGRPLGVPSVRRRYSHGGERAHRRNQWPGAAGLKAAVPTIIGDAIKGSGGSAARALVLFYLVFPDPDAMSVDEATMRATVLNLKVLAGGFAVIGHNWSFLNGFKGGAGGITTAATTLAISPLVGGMAIIIAAFVIWWTHLVHCHDDGRRLRLCHVPHLGRAGDVALALHHLWRHGAGGSGHRAAPQPREAARGQGASHHVVVNGTKEYSTRYECRLSPRCWN